MDAAPAGLGPRVYFLGHRIIVLGDADGYRTVIAPDEPLTGLVVAADGSAWIGTHERLLRHDGAAVVPVVSGQRMHPVAATRDGAVWALVEHGTHLPAAIVRFGGATRQRWTLAETGATGMMRREVIALDDGIAFVTPFELVRWTGGAWKVTPSPGPELERVGVSAAGEVVILARRARNGPPAWPVLRLDGDALIEVAMVDRDKELFSHRVERQADGTLLVGDRVFRDGKRHALALPYPLAIGADGTLYALDEDGVSLHVRSPDGTTRRYPETGSLPSGLDAVTIEGPRAWLRLRDGLAVIEDGTLRVVEGLARAGITGAPYAILPSGPTDALRLPAP